MFILATARIKGQGAVDPRRRRLFAEDPHAAADGGNSVRQGAMPWSASTADRKHQGHEPVADVTFRGLIAKQLKHEEAVVGGHQQTPIFDPVGQPAIRPQNSTWRRMGLAFPDRAWGSGCGANRKAARSYLALEGP